MDRVESDNPLTGVSMFSVRITPGIAAEYATREIGEPREPFDRLTAPGTYVLSPVEAAAVLADAEFYTEPYGPGRSLTAGIRNAYGSLVRQLRKLGVQDQVAEQPCLPTPPEMTGVEHQIAMRAKPERVQKLTPLVRLDSLPAGTRFRYKGTVLSVDEDQDSGGGRADQGWIFVAGGQRGLALAGDLMVRPL